MSEQFENSIRKKLQDAEIPFDPDAWEKMKKRLDNPRRRPAIFWWILSGLLIFIAAGSFWWWNQQSSRPVAEQRVPVADSLPSTETKTPASASSVGDTPLARVNTPGTTKAAIDEAGSTSASPAENPVSFRRPTQSAIPQNAPDDTAKQPTVITTPPANAVQQSVINTQSTTSPDTAKPSSIIAQKADTIKQASPAQQRDSLPQKKTRKGFEGGITIGPDVNIASSMKMGRIGLSTGIILRYHFNNRWSVQTGAIYTKKLYGATPNDYHFDYPVSYTKIDADCNVVDVPLNIGYTFSEGARDRWSAIAGASSYFMLNEKYDYYYANGTKRSHEFRNRNQHYFSVLNLGVSWERQTAGRLRLALQPYVKVPLGGVGQGKVKLYSAGIALQVTMGKK